MLDGLVMDVVGRMDAGFMLDGPPEAGLKLGLGLRLGLELPFPLFASLLSLEGLAGAGLFDSMGFREVTVGGVGVVLEAGGSAGI
jgi:hypothetical protein